MMESSIQSHIRLAMAYAKSLMYRNNSGACVDETGRLVRYGLGNDSKQQNDAIKSSDLIGGTPMLITPDMVGRTVLVFTAIECKAEGWELRPGDKRGQAQWRFIDIILRAGGFAGFARSPTEALAVIARNPTV